MTHAILDDLDEQAQQGTHLEMELTPHLTWASHIVGHSDESPLDLAAHPLNYRVHNLLQQETVLASVNEVGLIKSIVANKRTGRMLDGHLRCALAIKTNQLTVPVEWVDLPESAEAAAIAYLNFTESQSDVDTTKLDALLREVQTGDSYLQAMLASVVNDTHLYESPKRPEFGNLLEEFKEEKNAEKDGNWFYVEYYGQDEDFQALAELLAPYMTPKSKHQIGSNAFTQFIYKALKDLPVDADS